MISHVVVHLNSFVRIGFIQMEFTIKRTSQCLVAPSGPTPTEILELSVIDRLPVLRCNARTLHIFKYGPQAAPIIREALSKALIPYYPLAGRLHISIQNELQISCTGEGIWFVEANADTTLEAVNYFDDAMSIQYDKLLPVSPEDNDNLDPLVQMQVTQFNCGGFVIGLVFCHTICDGLGAAQFLNAVGELARGADHPRIKPEWCRDFIPSQQSNTPNPDFQLPNFPDYQLQHATIDISMERIKQLKQKFNDSITGENPYCSTFEILAALLWRQRTRAINLNDRYTKVQLVFFANCRQLIKPSPLPKGFYGNCFFPVTVTADAGMLTSLSIFEAVKLIQEAKAGLFIEFDKWIGKGSNGSGDPFAPPLEYTTLFISEWGRLGFNQVDYGWGNPVHVVPIQGSSIIPVGIVCSQPASKMGARIMTWCVSAAHLGDMLNQIDNLS